ncbi:MAG TPA: aldehyde dehydrogenase family protein, partial [Phenylobacterium sp.]|nr:aldehyde dehydrogenase family protein [Phenylobacterium sp.]
GIDVYSMRQPLGVAAGITPFNFPAMIPMWMFGIAIATGNSFILKPSEKDPSVPVRLAELMMEAGAPSGVLNVIHGDKAAVDAILDHPAIAAVSFVGSSDIAHYVYSRGSAAGKRVQAMGGAKNHGIILPDADLEQATRDIIGAAYGSAGERCMALPVRLGELMMEAGAPSGVLNVVHGDKVAVDAILDHPDIKAVSFVGSSDIAAYVYATGAAHGKRVQAMGGAKNHGVILPDADLDSAVKDIIGAAYGSAGERCMALPVVVPVGAKTADALRERLLAEIDTLKVGLSTDPAAQYGPVVSAAHRTRIEDYIQLGVGEGAELVVDGRGFSLQGYDEGFFIGPSMFDRVKPDMRTYKEEIFGPVLQIVRAETFEEAVALPSQHQYGNGVAIFTRNGRAAREFAAQVNVGMVGINVPIPVPVAYHSFGGWKRSAFGDTNQHGMEGVRFYTKIKTVTARWPEGLSEDSAFVIPTMR